MSEVEPTITASRTIRFNMDNFEHVETTRIIKDLPGDMTGEEIDAWLDKLMAGDIIRARQATAFKPPDQDGTCLTSVYYWADLMEAEGHI